MPVSLRYISRLLHSLKELELPAKTVNQFIHEEFTKKVNFVDSLRLKQLPQNLRSCFRRYSRYSKLLQHAHIRVAHSLHSSGKHQVAHNTEIFKFYPPKWMTSQ